MFQDKYDLIIFDCDGTLVDTETISNQLISDMMNEIGIQMSPKKCLDLFKGTQFKNITDYIESNIETPLSFNFENLFRKRCHSLFEKDLKEIEGATWFINLLKIPYCVASNGPRIKMNSSLKITGLSRHFDESNIFSAYDIDKFKPLPDLFLLAAEKNNTHPSKCLVFEDTVPGIEGAFNAKMDVIGIHHPGINDEILEICEKTVKSYRELKF